MIDTVQVPLSDPESVHVTLYHRSELPPGSSLHDVIDRLDHLADHGCIDELSVREWPARATTTSSDHSSAFRLFERLDRAADRMSISLAPFFERYRRVNHLLDSEEEVLVFPTFAIEVTDAAGGETRALAPCSTGHTTCSFEDMVRALELNNPTGASQIQCCP